MATGMPITSVRPNENYTNDPSSGRLETAQQVHLINSFSCISLPTMTTIHYVNGEYMLWKQLQSVVLYVDKRKPILDRFGFILAVQMSFFVLRIICRTESYNTVNDATRRETHCWCTLISDGFSLIYHQTVMNFFSPSVLSLAPNASSLCFISRAEM